MTAVGANSVWEINMKRTIAAGIGAAIGLASLGLSVEVAVAERPRGTNCVAGYSQCKAKANGSNPAIKACVDAFNKCVADNKDQHYNPYGYPNRAAVLSVPGLSVGKTSAASDTKTGTVATTTINAGAIGARTSNAGAAAATTTLVAPLSAPVKPPITTSSHTTVAQPGRTNFRAQ